MLLGCLQVDGAILRTHAGLSSEALLNLVGLSPYLELSRDSWADLALPHETPHIPPADEPRIVTIAMVRF